MSFAYIFNPRVAALAGFWACGPSPFTSYLRGKEEADKEGTTLRGKEGNGIHTERKGCVLERRY